MKVLVADVHVDGRVLAAGSVLSEEDAALVTNPAAFTEAARGVDTETEDGGESFIPLANKKRPRPDTADGMVDKAFARLSAELQADDEADVEPAPKPLGKHTVAELRDMCVDLGIDLDGVTLKADIVALIEDGA